MKNGRTGRRPCGILLLSTMAVSCASARQDAWTFALVREQMSGTHSAGTLAATDMPKGQALASAVIPLCIDLVVLPIALVHDVVFLSWT